MPALPDSTTIRAAAREAAGISELREGQEDAIRAVLGEERHDLLLLRFRLGGAAAAATRVAGRERERRRAVAVLARGVGAACEQRTGGLNMPLAGRV